MGLGYPLPPPTPFKASGIMHHGALEQVPHAPFGEQVPHASFGEQVTFL